MSRLSTEKLHEVFLNALGEDVLSASPTSLKPLEVDLNPHLISKIRLYIYNMTNPPGGRTVGELKIQLIVPGQARGERGSFDESDGRTILLVGYHKELDVFGLWDAGLYTDFSYSRNVQMYSETVISAFSGKIAERERLLKSVMGREIQIAVNSKNLRDRIIRRKKRTLERILNS